MPALCLCFNIHEPYQFRRYTVFDMGQSSVYEDDDRNCETMLRAARLCYLPAAEMLLRLVRRRGDGLRGICRRNFGAFAGLFVFTRGI